jgi:selenocysteine-specific elongation factor
VHVVATAGHVDHGKSTLVLALTGTDPDRLAEEKARGLTIDLGFAFTTLTSGREVAFVDVPGHVRFIRNMLAGVGAVDACLFVVAATEGWKAQSEEHLRILELLGVRAGVVALTKVAGLDDDWVELVRMEVGEAVAGSFLDRAEVVAVDAPAGLGLAELREAMDRLLALTPTAADRGRPRLWVDRGFPARGVGTVVTGTLTGGCLEVGAEVVLVGPGGQGSRSARVRGLQSHGRQIDHADPGCRLALNLAGIGHGGVIRGDAVILGGQWARTRTFDASLAVLANLGHEVTQRGAYQVYLGSGEYPAKVRVLGGKGVLAGGSGLVRLHISTTLPLLPGDRYVLRESGRAETVGGGEVLDVAPVIPASRARPDRSVDRVIAERGWVKADALELLTGEKRVPNIGGRWCVDPQALARASAKVRAAVAAAGVPGLDLALLDERHKALAQGLVDLVIEGGRIRLFGYPTGAERLAHHHYLAELEASPFAPPEPIGVDRAELSEMIRLGLVTECEGVCFCPSAVAAASEVVANLLAEHPGGVTAGQVKEALGTTRRWLIPLLGHLDATGVTRRRGALRVAGPRIPPARIPAAGTGAPPTGPGPEVTSQGSAQRTS